MAEPYQPATAVTAGAPETAGTSMDTGDKAILDTPVPTLEDVPDIEPDPQSFDTMFPPTSP